MRSAETSRWYGGLTAVVAGGYALSMAVWGSGMSDADWFVLVLGGVVLGHGVALVARLPRQLHTASGALLVVYAVLLFVGQGWMGVTTGGGMPLELVGGAPIDHGVGWSTLPVDPGMAALSAVLLGTGIVMTASESSST